MIHLNHSSIDIRPILAQLEANFAGRAKSGGPHAGLLGRGRSKNQPKHVSTSAAADAARRMVL